MCRSDIAPAAREHLGRILSDMATALAATVGVPPGDVRIGPVDFGGDEIPCSDSCWAEHGDSTCPCGVGTEDGERRPPAWEWTDQ